MSRVKRADQQLDDAHIDDSILSGVTPPSRGANTPTEELIELESDVDSGQDDDPLTVLQRSYADLKAEAEKHRLDAEAAREQALQASRTADGYRLHAEQTGLEAKQASIAAIDTSTAHTKNNIAALKAEIARSAAAQEWDVFAEAQEVLTQNISYLQQLTESRTATENRHSAAPRTPEPESDRIEQFIGTLTPRSQRWLRDHKADIFSTPAKQNKAQAAHNMAIADGFEADSDSYFKELDKYMGYGGATSTTHHRQPSAVASAPPARTNPASPASSDQVRLSKVQQETAMALYPDKKPEDAKAIYADGLRQIRSGKTNLMLSSDKYRGGYNGV